jgi:TRAP-type C4-dicarboxylate transport system permease small subunit
MGVNSDSIVPTAPVGAAVTHAVGVRRDWLVGLLEGAASLLLVALILNLILGVVSRYVFSSPILMADELSSFIFLWFVMLGAAIAINRNEHLRLTVVIDRIDEPYQSFCKTLALLIVAAFLTTLLPFSIEHVQFEWVISMPMSGAPAGARVAGIALGIVLMLYMVVARLLQTSAKRHILFGVLCLAALLGALWLLRPVFLGLGMTNVPIFLIGLLLCCLLLGVPIAFCFGAAALSFIVFSTDAPISVVLGRMDEGMSSLILLSVPVFLLLGCILDRTGMGKAIVRFLSSVIGHVRAGMSYALLGSLYLVSGISGTKVSDMATVAPALFPEMKKRGDKPADMVALCRPARSWRTRFRRVSF